MSWKVKVKVNTVRVSPPGNNEDWYLTTTRRTTTNPNNFQVCSLGYKDKALLFGKREDAEVAASQLTLAGCSSECDCLYKSLLLAVELEECA